MKPDRNKTRTQYFKVLNLLNEKSSMFSGDEIKPLQKLAAPAIVKLTGCTWEEAFSFLAMWCTTTRYYGAVYRGGHRYNLNGTIAEEVTMGECLNAAKKLLERANA